MTKEEIPNPNPEDELEKAQKKVQNPTLFENISAQAGIEMAIESDPSEGESVTGDFYRVIRLDDGRLSIFIGDVAGCGRGAAEVTLKLHSFMETFAFKQSYQERARASAILEFIDQHNPSPPRGEPFLNLAHILLNPETGQLEYANAGIPYLYIRKRNGQVLEIESSGLFVGWGYSNSNSGTTFTEISPGDMVILMSDGIAYARDKNGIMMKKSFRELLQQMEGTMKPKEIVQYIISQIVSPREDDATILVFQLPG